MAILSPNASLPKPPLLCRLPLKSKTLKFEKPKLFPKIETQVEISIATMAPTEDTIEALLDYLVSPLLPLRESNYDVPSDHQQEMIAKQLHAIVIIYNYYHRKQFPKLEFLGFESFCKICCIAKPGLFPYLRYMHRSEEDSENVNNQLSITEKMVMDACNICIGLNSQRDSVIEGWPVSKVAVFLVHPTEEKCVLQFCNITQGVWSLVEKDLEAPSENGPSQTESYKSDEKLEQLAFLAVEQETGIRRSDLSILEQHLTYSLSREKTATQLYIMKYGSTLSEEVMEVSIKDVIRSLNGPIVKKDSTYEITSVVEYFSILPYTEIISSWLSRDFSDHISLDIRKQQIVNEKKRRLDQNEITLVKDHDVKINFASNQLILNMQNSRPSKSETIEANGRDLSKVNGSPRPATRVENTTSTPFIEPDRLSIVSDQAPNDKSLQNGLDESVPNSKKNKLKDAITYNRRAGGSSGSPNSCKLMDSKHDKLPTTEENGISTKSGSNEQNLNVNGNTSVETESRTTNKHDNGVSKNSSSNEQKMDVEINIAVETESRFTKKNISDLSSNNETSWAIARLQNMETDGPATMNDQTTDDVSFQSRHTKDSITCKMDNIEDAIPSNRKSGDSCMRMLSVAIDSCKGNDLTFNDHQKHSQKDDITGKTIIPDAPVNKENSCLRTELPVSLGGCKEQAGPVNSVKCLIEDRTYGNSVKGVNREVSALGDLSLVPLQSNSNEHSTFCHVAASRKNDLLQASLRVLQKKRDELYQQKHFLEDEIARCEMNIQTIFRGEENPTLKIDTIVEALNYYCSSQVQTCMNLPSEDQSPSQTIKRRKLSEAVLSSRNSCQELDDICQNNGWMLPKYSVLPSFADSQITGMFKATVTVHGMDFECTSDGDCKDSPREARESAATQMLSKLRAWQAGER